MTSSYANISFRVPKNVKEQFALLTELHNKKGVEMFTELVQEAVNKPLSNVQLRTLPPDVRRKILLERNKTAQEICAKYADELYIDDILEDLE